MESEMLLEMYRAEKWDIRQENFRDNSKGSPLLFEVRAGCLRTKEAVGKYNQKAGACEGCAKETETIRHILLECDCIHPNLWKGNIRLPYSLDFKGNAYKVNYKAVEGTKRRLECWWGKREEENITQATNSSAKVKTIV